MNINKQYKNIGIDDSNIVLFFKTIADISIDINKHKKTDSNTFNLYKEMLLNINSFFNYREKVSNKKDYNLTNDLKEVSLLFNKFIQENSLFFDNNFYEKQTRKIIKETNFDVSIELIFFIKSAILKSENMKGIINEIILNGFDYSLIKSVIISHDSSNEIHNKIYVSMTNLKLSATSIKLDSNKNSALTFYYFLNKITLHCTTLSILDKDERELMYNALSFIFLFKNKLNFKEFLYINEIVIKNNCYVIKHEKRVVNIDDKSININKIIRGTMPIGLIEIIIENCIIDKKTIDFLFEIGEYDYNKNDFKNTFNIEKYKVELEGKYFRNAILIKDYMRSYFKEYLNTKLYFDVLSIGYKTDFIEYLFSNHLKENGNLILLKMIQYLEFNKNNNKITKQIVDDIFTKFYVFSILFLGGVNCKYKHKSFINYLNDNYLIIAYEMYYFDTKKFNNISFSINKNILNFLNLNVNKNNYKIINEIKKYFEKNLIVSCELEFIKSKYIDKIIENEDCVKEILNVNLGENKNIKLNYNVLNIENRIKNIDEELILYKNNISKNNKENYNIKSLKRLIMKKRELIKIKENKEN